MVRYAGQFSYTTAQSHRHGDLARIIIDAELLAPYISISIHDGRFDTIHTLANSRFDFKARDSPRDLRSRDSWTSDWVDCFRGIARLVTPGNTKAPNQINMLIYASWDPAFVVIEFAIGNDYCQFATRTRPGSSGRWVRSNPPPSQPPPKMIQPSDKQAMPDVLTDDSSAATATIEAPSSVSTDTNVNAPSSSLSDGHESIERDADAPIQVNFARIAITLNLKCLNHLGSC